MTDAIPSSGSLARYTAASQRAAGRIIASYSTSFGMATRLLGARHRTHVRCIYALARVADELVDGATAEAGIPAAEQHVALALLEAETERALDSGYSSNPIVHAFAHAARDSSIGPELTRPFFASMRTDLPSLWQPDETGIVTPSAPTFDDRAHADYVFGSAEVIGLMCLSVFLRTEHRTDEQLRLLENGARQLGAAFQNVNFLRDLADDTGRLGRSYLSESGHIDDAQQQRWVAVIRQQLAAAAESLPLLPADARLAVCTALRLFSRLTERIARTPAEHLYRRRLRVPAHEKAWLIGRAVLETRKGYAQ